MAVGETGRTYAKMADDVFNLDESGLFQQPWSKLHIGNTNCERNKEVQGYNKYNPHHKKNKGKAVCDN